MVETQEKITVNQYEHQDIENLDKIQKAILFQKMISQTIKREYPQIKSFKLEIYEIYEE